MSLSYFKYSIFILFSSFFISCVSEKIIEGKWSNGQSKSIVIYSDKKKKEKGKYKKIYFYESGKKESEVDYYNQLISGKVIGWYQNGKRHTVDEYKDNLLIASNSWYENGKRMVERTIFFRDTVMRFDSLLNDSIAIVLQKERITTWYENGQLKSQLQHLDKNRDLIKYWNAFGELIKEEEYRDGELIRTQEYIENGVRK
jgi:antitoxin component YwqK of YwqJK toxin-antitoxin module